MWAERRYTPSQRVRQRWGTFVFILKPMSHRRRNAIHLDSRQKSPRRWSSLQCVLVRKKIVVRRRGRLWRRNEYSKMFITVVAPPRITTIFAHAQRDFLDSFWFVLVRSCNSLNLVLRRCCNRRFPLWLCLQFCSEKGRFYSSWNRLNNLWKYIKIFIELPEFLKSITRYLVAPCDSLHKSWVQQSRWDLIESGMLR